jgi:hypothetical protein
MKMATKKDPDREGQKSTLRLSPVNKPESLLRVDPEHALILLLRAGYGRSRRIKNP